MILMSRGKEFLTYDGKMFLMSHGKMFFISDGKQFFTWIKVVSRIEWEVVITFILWKETTMRQVQLHKAMLMQEVQQLKSANVPKIEAYRRLNAEAKKISWPTFLKYYNADEVPSAKSISGNYEKQKVFDVEPFRKEIIRCLEANIDNKDLKVSSI